MGYAIIGGIVAVLIAIGFAFFSGKSAGSQAEQNQTLKKIDQVQDEQAKIATESNDLPTTIDSLRKHDF